MSAVAGVNTGRMWKWLPAAVGVNLLLGIPGVVPLWLLWYFASNGPLADIGWTRREPTENDGMLFWLVAALAVNCRVRRGLVVRQPARCGAGRRSTPLCTGRPVP